MALIPQAIEDRIKELEDLVMFLGEKVALLEEALAPAEHDEVRDILMEEIEYVNSNIR